MFWYVTIFFLCILGFFLNNYCIKEQRYKKIVDICLIVILCLTTGTRYNIGGYDFDVYHTVYNNVPKLLNFNIFTVHNIVGVYGMEKGFLFLCSFFKTIGFTYYGFNLICSIVFYICMYLGLKKFTNNFTFVLFIFLYKLFIFDTFVLTRQMLCIGGFMFLLRYIKEKNFVKYLIGCMILFTLHTSSLVLIPVYFINKINFSKKTVIILNCVFLTTLLFNLLDVSIIQVMVDLLSDFNFLGGKFSTYLNYLSDSGRSINLLNTIEYELLMCWVIYRYDDLKNSNDNNVLFINLFLILLPILTLFRGYEIMARIKDYFIIVYAIILLALCELKTLKIRVPKAVMYLLIICIAFAGYVRSVMTFDSGNLIPYDTYLDNNVRMIDYGG